ncbi:MAG: hypothetical protein AB1473_07390 [Thermodesulfobacteriota bacterium]
MTTKKHALLIVVVCILAATPHLYRLTASPSRFLHDDAYYYFKTAHNIVQGHGSTFDTFNQTNGYHPLWMGVCILAGLVTLNSSGYVFVILAFNLLFILLLSWQVLRMFSSSLGFAFSAGLVFLINWNLYTGLNLLSGMETSLHLWLILVVVDYANRISWKQRRDLILLGALLGLTFLSRTSFVLFLPVLAFYVLSRPELRTPGVLLRIGFLVVAPFALIVAPYLAWNYHTTGHLQQISGLVKDFWPTALSAWEKAQLALTSILKPVLLRPLWLNGLLLASVGGLALICIRQKERFGFLQDARLAMLVGFSLLLLAYYVTNYGENTRAWHYMVPWITAQILFVHGLKVLYDAMESSQVARVGLSVLLVGILIDYFVQIPTYIYKGLKVHPYYQSPVDYSEEMARWMKEHLPKDARIGVFNAGYIGYFSERNVVNLDGLINGVEFYQYLKDGRGVWKYVLDQKLDYIADYFFGPPGPALAGIESRLTLIHNVGPTNVSIRGKASYVDAYIWKVESQHERHTTK